MGERTARLPLWARVAVPLVVVAVALVIGSGAFDAGSQTVAQRAAAIEANVRCPSCTDLSVAQSNATTAIAVRHQIESMVAAGRSTSAIDQVLVAEYGQTILLVPPDAGGVPLIWVVPLVLGRRRPGGRRRRLLAPEPRLRRAEGGSTRRMTVDGSPTVERTDQSTRDDRWYLADEREFLRRSLDDADREHEAGDLSDEDHAVLVARDAARLAEVEAELAALGPEPAAAAPSPVDPVPERRPLPLWRRVGIVVACLLIATGAGVLVVHFVQSRQPGQSSSGSVSLSQAQLIEQQLQQALALNNKGNTKGALELYNKVLAEDPSNPVALADAGYLQWNVGSAAHVAALVRIGRAEIETAVKDSPSYSQGHLFYGLVLENQDHNHAAAVAQFNDFLADGPPAGELAQAAPLVAGAYQGAGVPLPAAFSDAAKG